MNNPRTRITFWSTNPGAGKRDRKSPLPKRPAHPRDYTREPLDYKRGPPFCPRGQSPPGYHRHGRRTRTAPRGQREHASQMPHTHMHTPGTRGRPALRRPPQTRGAQPRPVDSAPRCRHKLLLDRAAPTVARDILKVHGVAWSDVNTQPAGGREDRHELSHGAFYRGIRRNLFGNRARTRRCRYDGKESRLLRKANFGGRGRRRRNRTRLGWGLHCRHFLSRCH